MTKRWRPFNPVALAIGLIVAVCITVVTPVPCVPVEGKTALTIGQDFYSITNYSRAMGPILGKVRTDELHQSTGLYHHPLIALLSHFIPITADRFLSTPTATYLHQPFGVMSYTALRSDTGDLTGLTDPIDYGSGTEWASGLIDIYNTSALQLGLWLVGACEDVAEGLLNKEIKVLATYLASLSPTR